MEHIRIYTELFFIYSSLGFFWETLWVSYQKGSWVQRGFLHGPILPIYGFGALAVTIATSKVADHRWFVFFLGMAVATFLELITGMAIEKIFHVRYWDYDDRPFNYKGYICLRSTVFWGIMSVVIVEMTNKEIIKMLHFLHFPHSQWVLYAVLLVFAADIYFSVRDAFTLRDLLHAEEEVSDYVEKALSQLELKVEEKREELLHTLENISYKSESLAKEAKQLSSKSLRRWINGRINVKMHYEKMLKMRMTEKLEENINHNILRELSEKSISATNLVYQRRMKRLDRMSRRMDKLMKRNDLSYRL